MGQFPWPCSLLFPLAWPFPLAFTLAFAFFLPPPPDAS
jgi:hypothetical protein